jgi:hypothetical protein
MPAHGSRVQKIRHAQSLMMVVIHDTSTSVPIIFFGAFDRHNFGDLLFPHVVNALAVGEDAQFAGLAERDLRACGGHRVEALAEVAARWRDRPVNIFHVGGELLTCDAWQAAAMLMRGDQAKETIARLDRQPNARMYWARGVLGLSSLAPYTVSRDLFPRAAAVVYNAVGGVDLDSIDPATRGEVLAKLAAADYVSVRDKRTQALLAAAGIAAPLMPDCAVMVAELFGAEIRERSHNGEAAQVLQAFPQGYIAVQFSADFGDDETLAEVAAQIDRIALSSGYGVAFFRAGAAPWHDELACYERVAACMRAPSVKIFRSLNLWDICALIAGSRGYCGSSLHGRIVAMAFGLPRMNMVSPVQAARPTKQAAFAAAWEGAGVPAIVAVDQIADGMRDALATDPQQRFHIAADLAARYRQGFAAIRDMLRQERV